MDWKPIMQNKWLLVLAGIGVLCLVLGSFRNRSGASAVPTLAGGNPSVTSISQQTGQPAGGKSSDPTAVYEALYDDKLTKMLQEISGVNNVSVMVTVDSTDTQNLATNRRETTETQSGGQAGSSKSTTVNEDVFTKHNGDGSDTPVVVQTVSPAVRGVLVLVDANDFYIAKSEIIDAIQHVLDVPAYKISVEPKKSNP